MKGRQTALTSPCSLPLLPGRDALGEALGEGLWPPARGERAQERCVGAPALRVSGARAPAAANLLAGRDQRARPLGEFEHARLFAARHVDDLAAAALALAGEYGGKFEHGGGGVLDVQVVARLLARP